LLAGGLTLLAACSTTDFTKPINDFGTATGNASTTFSGYADALEKLNQDQNVSDVVDDPDLLKVVGCKLSGPAKCELTVRGDALQPKFLVNTRKVMAAIVSYSTNLQAIANADDIGKLKSASDAIPADINGLAKAADGLSTQLGHPSSIAGQVAAFTTPAGQIISIALTQYAEYEKLQALRDATTRMDGVFTEAMALMSAVAIVNQNITNRALFRKYEKARAAYAVALGAVRAKQKTKPASGASAQDVDAYNQQIAALQSALSDALQSYDAAAQAFDAGLTAKPQDAFTKLAQAHTALVDALTMPSPDFQTVFQKIQEFVDIATTLVSDAKKIDDALHPKTAH
jgi:hypothetical protein